MEKKEFPSYPIYADPRQWAIGWQKTYEKSLLIFVTGRCNLQCKNCFSLSTRSEMELSLEDIELVVDANPTYNRIDIMGGEPLLYNDLSPLLQMLRKKKKRITIYTNGLLLHKVSGLGALRICVSFHEIESNDSSRKPIMPIIDKLRMFAENKDNHLKLVLLLDSINAEKALKIIDFVDYEMPFVKKLTIGLMRYENDYWNDDYPGVLSFKNYAVTVQRIVDFYKGRLNLDVFLKGVLEFPEDQGQQVQRVNRFRCVFPNLTYSDCLYNACDTIHPRLGDLYKFPANRNVCKHTGREKCLADKVHLVRNI